MNAHGTKAIRDGNGQLLLECQSSPLLLAFRFGVTLLTAQGNFDVFNETI